MIIPYRLLLEKVELAGDTATIPRKIFDYLLYEMLLFADFDEDVYLRLNPDVAGSMRKGEFKTAKQHFAEAGYVEGRDGVGLAVSEIWYLEANPDVAHAVKIGDWASGEMHYNHVGLFEWRAPNEAAVELFANWKELMTGSKIEAEPA